MEMGKLAIYKRGRDINTEEGKKLKGNYRIKQLKVGIVIRRIL